MDGRCDTPPRTLLAVFAAAATLAATATAAAQTPSLVREGRRLFVSGLPDVPARAEVVGHLASGLTTTFAFQVSLRDSRGARGAGGAMVEIRFEPWDEVYLVAATGFDGRRDSWRLPSAEALAAWWRELRLAVAEVDLAAGDAWQAHLELSVIPFSSAEQRDTQRWVSRSLAAARREADGSAPGAEPVAAEAPAVSGVLDVLLATSIGRDSLIRYDWRLTAPPGEARR